MDPSFLSHNLQNKWVIAEVISLSVNQLLVSSPNQCTLVELYDPDDVDDA